jgi:hypothetical protein
MLWASWTESFFDLEHVSRLTHSRWLGWRKFGKLFDLQGFLLCDLINELVNTSRNLRVEDLGGNNLRFKWLSLKLLIGPLYWLLNNLLAWSSFLRCRESFNWCIIRAFEVVWRNSRFVEIFFLHFWFFESGDIFMRLSVDLFLLEFRSLNYFNVLLRVLIQRTEAFGGLLLS